MERVSSARDGKPDVPQALTSPSKGQSHVGMTIDFINLRSCMLLSIFYSVPGESDKEIFIPNEYKGYISQEDVQQIAEGLRAQRQGFEPLASMIKKSVINLARQRKGE